MIKRIGATLAALTLALGATLAGSASPALAVGACPTGGICFYDTGVSANWMEYLDRADIAVGRCRVMPSAANNKTSYIVNNGGSQWRTYSNADCTGTNGAIYAYSSGTMDAAHNNNISAYKRIS